MGSQMYVLGWTFADGSVYCVAWGGTEYRQWVEANAEDPPVGMWRVPFPNTAGNSFAHGQLESLMQSDIGPLLRERHGKVRYLQCWWSDVEGRRVAREVA